jgi:multidrug efflux system membrane fusion protein
MLWPGELINARLLLETRHNGLTMTAAAVQQGPQGPFVWVIASDKTVTTRPVKATDIGDGNVLIDSGLQANEKVVVDGQYRLQPGTRVQELQANAAKQADLQNSVEQEIP